MTKTSTSTSAAPTGTATVVASSSSSSSLVAAQAVGLKAPKKKFFRSRAHCNPLSHNDSFNYPVQPDACLWEEQYPNIPENERIVRILDIGMGFGGMTVALSQLFPSTLVLGMEIRSKVCEYVRLRIEALRSENNNNGAFENAGCLRTNCMRYLPNYFRHEQIEKIFICFPDPHFKAKNHRRRIISFNMLTEYAYLIRPNGLLYTVTDVEELHKWHVEKCSQHPCFERVSEEVLATDPCLPLLLDATEESKKVARVGGKKFYAVFRRRSENELPTPLVYSLFDDNSHNNNKVV